MGNNFDTRKNLSIVKTPIDPSSNKTELIEFNYPEQVIFTTTYSQSQYDAEALISVDDYLIILTKNSSKKSQRFMLYQKLLANTKQKKLEA